MIGGVLVVDKPRGPTSHDVVARLRRALRTREIGHAGTLDPMATGVLVLAIGEATKLVPFLTAHDKAYVATLRLGVATASLDAEGAVIESRPIDDALRTTLSGGSSALTAAVEAERARTEQIPPAVSAIKIGGVAAHERTRRGEIVDLAARPVAVHHLAITAARVDPPELDLEVECAKGYYVRSLARDLAERLGTLGHLTMLRRTRSGPFTLEHARSLEEAERGEGLVPLALAASRALPAVQLTDEGVIRARHGKKLSTAAEGGDFVEPPAVGVAAWLHGDHLIAVGERSGDEARVVRGFRSE